MLDPKMISDFSDLNFYVEEKLEFYMELYLRTQIGYKASDTRSREQAEKENRILMRATRETVRLFKAYLNKK